MSKATDRVHPAMFDPARWAPQLRRDVETRPFGDEAVAWSPRGFGAVYLDAIATIVHQFFDGATTLQDIADDVQHVFGLPSSVAMAKLRRIADQLESAGMLATERVRQEPLEDHPIFPGPPNP